MRKNLVLSVLASIVCAMGAFVVGSAPCPKVLGNGDLQFLGGLDAPYLCSAHQTDLANHPCTCESNNPPGVGNMACAPTMQRNRLHCDEVYYWGCMEWPDSSCTPQNNVSCGEKFRCNPYCDSCPTVLPCEALGENCAKLWNTCS